MPTQVTIQNGGFQDALGNKINGTLDLQLPQDALISGTGQIAPKIISITVTAGNAAATPVWGNDVLTPSGLAYRAVLFDTVGARVWGPEYWSITGAGPIDISTLLPAFTSPIWTAPTSGPADTVQGFSTTSSVGFTGGTNTMIKATGGASGITLTLPTAAGVSGQQMRFIRIDAAAGGVTISGTGGQTINGRSTWLLQNQWQFIVIESDGTNWMGVSYN